MPVVVQIGSNSLGASTESIGFARRAAWGAAVLALVVLFAPIADAKEHKYVGAKKCKTCHKKEAIGNQYEVWLESNHAKAYETLSSEEAMKWAREAGVDDPQTDAKCVKCHSTAYGVPKNLVSKKFKRTGGVECEACHGPGKDYRKKKIMIDPERAESKGLIAQSEKVCIACHNDDSPAWDSERYTRMDGTKVGFDYEKAVALIAHPVPEDYDPKAAKEDDEDE